MDRRLYEASLRGDVSSFTELLEEDPLVLDKVIIAEFYGTTPLHIAAMRGHIDFARKLLSLKPELAFELDSQGFYPLHLASAKKNVDMVKLLLGANLNACNETDKEGRTPVHVAAVKGRVEIMKVLIKSQPQAIHKCLPYQNETILHLCVKHNRLEALKLLVGVVSVNSRDDNGNTILHLSVARRDLKMVKYLLDSNIGVELNATNNKGYTAMDILTQSTETRGLKDIEIGDLLRDAGAVVSLGEISTTVGRKNEKLHDEETLDKWLKQKQNTLMVVASLIAGIAFQGGMNPPGGVWQGNADDERTTNIAVRIHGNFLNSSPAPQPFRLVGTSIMAQIAKEGYILFMTFNTIGFLASLSIIFLLISGLCVKRRSFVGLLMGVLWISITFMALTYLIAVLCVFPNAHRRWGLSPTTPVAYTLLAWFGLLGLVVCVHIIRFVSWLLEKLGILKKKKLNTEEGSSGSAHSSASSNIIISFVIDQINKIIKYITKYIMKVWVRTCR